MAKGDTWHGFCAGSSLAPTGEVLKDEHGFALATCDVCGRKVYVRRDALGLRFRIHKPSAAVAP